MATNTAFLFEYLFTAFDCFGVGYATQLVNRRRRWQSFDKRGECQDFFIGRLSIALHGFENRVANLQLKRLGRCGPRERLCASFPKK